MRLSELQSGQSAVITKVIGHGGFQHRLMEMGFVRGHRVTALLSAPLKGAIKYQVMSYEVSLRRSEADMIEIVLEEQSPNDNREFIAVVDEQGTFESVKERINTINIALVGNPNCGKTSLFNALSGGREHIGNYSGVTVGAKIGSFKYKGYKFEITDLPGTYALSGYSPEELCVREHLSEKMPDVVVNVVAASNLERNLYLTTELIDANLTMVVALNMYDELKSSGSTLKHEELGKMLGTVMVPVVARSEKGIDELLDNVISVFERQNSSVRHIHITHSAVIEKAITKLTTAFKEDTDSVPPYFPPRYWALKMLEKDKPTEKIIAKSPNYKKYAQLRDRGVKQISGDLGEDVATAMASEKYGFIEGALLDVYTMGERSINSRSARVDRFVTSGWFGFPIFFAVLALMFYSTFELGAYPMDWIDSGVGMLGDWVSSVMSDGVLKSMVVDGIIGGVGSVIVFLPNIVILYLFISLMEDSGYLARTAFIMDKFMHKIGLHGKSFIPLLMGFGCNVPSIIATRTIESHSSRLITMLINPFMSCSARLPVFILIAGVFFPENAALMVMAMYMLGIVVAILSAIIMRKLVFKKDETPFVMEIPPYRMPTLKATLKHMWERAAQYLLKMGKFMVVASILVWFLSYYPRPEVEPYDMATREAAMENSYLGHIGKAIEPAMEPMGLNWKTGVALFSGVAAKEVVVSTLGVLYEAEDEDEATLSQKLISSGDFTKGSALAFMIFILLYVPCIATVVAIGKESGSWWWAVVSVVYSTSLAWLLGVLTYNIF